MTVRITPGTRKQTGPVNALVAQVMGLAAGTRAPNVFTTIGRNRSLFRRWMVFNSGLMPFGRLPRRDTELVILRTAYLCGCDYEWDHHVRLGRRAGVTAADVDRLRAGPDADGWTPRDAALVRAVGELHGADRRIGDGTWAELRQHLDEADTIEFLMLVGNYEMLAMTLNSLGVEQDVRRPRLSRLLRMG